jgi:hypothetical protein
VKPNLNKYWVFRFSYLGKQQNMSLGVFPDTTINEARQKALQARNELKNGVNPLQARKASKSPLKAFAQKWKEILSAFFSGAFSSSATTQTVADTYLDVTGAAVAITPRYANSYVQVLR